MNKHDYFKLKVGDKIFLATSKCISKTYRGSAVKIVAIDPAGTRTDHDDFGLDVRISLGTEARHRMAACCLELFDPKREPRECLEAINRHRDNCLQRKLVPMDWTDDDLRLEAVRFGV